MIRRGQRVTSGSRLEYIITDYGTHTSLQADKIEHIDYFKKHKDVLRVDYLYYLKLLSNPMDQVLNVMYSNTLEKDFVLNQYKFRYKIRQKMLNELNNNFRAILNFI